MSEEYNIEKWVWSETDFERMGWHDCQIHALAFSRETFELVFDIDYIFDWVCQEPNDSQTGTWVAPATLVFANVYEVEFDIESWGGLEIDALKRHEPRTPHNAEYVQRETEWLWDIECQEGNIKLRSVGYKQYIRAKPQLSQKQKLDISVRGGYSFTRGRTDAI